MSTPLQAALDCVSEAAGVDESKQLIAAKVRGLLVGYDARWRDVEWASISEEEVFHLPIINPETGKPSRTFTHAGKYDGIVEYVPSGKRYLRELKTTSDDIEDPNSTYWRRLVIDSQVSGYVLANWQDGRKLDGTLYEVIRKPGIRPKKIPKAEQKAIASLGEYHGFRLSMAERSEIANVTDPVETYRLYELRLARDTLNNPEKYFQRRPVPRLDADVLEYAGELWDVAKSIIEARRENRHYRNSGACMNYNTPCEFLGLCSGHDSPDSDRWERAEWRHEELPEIAEDRGLSVLTNSRVRCFMTCRRKHFYRYEQGLRRFTEDEREALVLGDLMHRGLEEWWSHFRKEE